MDRLWPVDGTSQSTTGEDSVSEPGHELESFYAYPAELHEPWLRVNFVASLDGAVTVRGSSRGLSTPADQRVLKLIRDLSDVVLVGLRTAMIEGYRGIRPTEPRRQRRRRRGLTDAPPLALVTQFCSLGVDSPLVTDTAVAPIVLTCAAAPAERRAELAAAGVDVVVAGDEQVDLRASLAALDDRGLRRIGCEGGPTLFGALVDDDLVDELCLTMSPLLAGGDAGRIATGPHVEPPRRMRLASALLAEESLLLLRYQRHRQRPDDSDQPLGNTSFV